jgi:hypothetical protein
LKKLFAIVALTGILLQTFSQAVIVAQYYANKDYIAKNLCENRDKPQLHCEGKCCLKKRLAKESKEQAPASKNQKGEQVVNLFYSDTRFELRPYAAIPVQHQYSRFQNNYTGSFNRAIFHPPTA